MQTFSKRLKKCVSTVGGMGALAKASGVSKPQILRYIKAESDPPITKLRAIADAAGIKLSWLVEGERSAGKYTSQVVLDKDVFLEVVEQVESVLANMGRTLTPKRKALLVFAMTKEAERAQKAEKDFLLSQQSLMEMLDFFSIFPDDVDVEEILKAAEYLPYETNKETADRWIDMICRAHASIYDTLSGKQYFDRMPEVSGLYGHEIDWIIAKAEAMQRSVTSFLDMGCGNGRHLTYINQNYPNIILRGIDASNYAVQLAKHREITGLLPKDTVKQGDMRQLPYEVEEFDVIMARFSLFCFPLSPFTEGGLHKVLAEIARVLKPGGMFHGMTEVVPEIRTVC